MGRLTERKIIDLVQTMSFEPLDIEILKTEYKIAKDSREKVDLLLNIGWGKISEEFITESKLKFVIFGLPRSKLTGHSPEN